MSEAMKCANFYEELDTTCEQPYYTNLTNIAIDVNRMPNTMTTLTTGPGPQRETGVGQPRNGNSFGPKGLSPSRDLLDTRTIKFFRCFVLVITMAVVCLIGWNVYLTMTITQLGSQTQWPLDQTNLSTYEPEVDVQSTTTQPATRSEKCPEMWIHHENSCYLFKDQKTTFDESSWFCSSEWGYLVHIGTESENNFIKEVCRKGQKYRPRIGLTDIKEEGIWVWGITGDEANFTDWANGEPNQGRGVDCVVLWEHREYQWADEPCDNKHGFICERPVLKMS